MAKQGVQLSILVPTSSERVPFWPWLAWSISKQIGVDWSTTEIIVATDRPKSMLTEHYPVPVRLMESFALSTPVHLKRNLLLQEARGRYVAWFDDDDWHDPHRLRDSLGLLKERGARGIFDTHRCYLRLADERVTRVRPARASDVLPITFVGERQLALEASFPIVRGGGSDTLWADELLRQDAERDPAIVVRYSSRPWLVALAHGANMTPHLKRWRYPLRLTRLREVLGVDAWADTSDHLAALRRRLGMSPLEG